MELKEILVENFRSVKNSGSISVSKSTALIGRNESGKSNLLQAISTLSSHGEGTGLDKSRFYPREMNPDDCSDSTSVVTSQWKLNQKEIKALANVWPSAKRVTFVELKNDYAGTLQVNFPEQLAPDQVFPVAEIDFLVAEIIHDIRMQYRRQDPRRRIRQSIGPNARPRVNSLGQTLDTFKRSMDFTKVSANQAINAIASISELRSSLTHDNVSGRKKLFECIKILENKIGKFIDEDSKYERVCELVINNMPIFVFLDAYPEINGRMNLSEYLNRISHDASDPVDENFGKMCKVANLDLKRLQKQTLSAARARLLEEASTNLTKEIQRLWTDKKLTIQLTLDNDDIVTLIAESTGTRATPNFYTELDERSRGFQWFFSFYMTFAADTMEGKAANAILLLDEPGLHLHASSQQDFLNVIEKRLSNQVIYTTHSPFMVPTRNLESIKTVTYDKTNGTTVSNDPTAKGDSKTLLPLQAALGYDITQGLFIGENNLVVEGVTDYWILSSVSKHLFNKKMNYLHENITIMPVGGVFKICYMVALLSAYKLNVLVLLDSEIHAQRERDKLVKAMLIKQNRIVFVSEAFENSDTRDADIEDLLGDDSYKKLVLESHSKELKGKNLKYVSQSPRIAKRFEEDFKEIKVKFRKTRPLQLLFKKLSEDANEIMTPEAEERFSRLFQRINSLVKKKN